MPYKDKNNPKIIAYKAAYHQRMKDDPNHKAARKRAVRKYQKENRLSINNKTRDAYTPEKAKASRDRYKETINANFKKKADELSELYMIRQLKKAGWTEQQLKENPEIISTQRIIIKTKRL